MKYFKFEPMTTDLNQLYDEAIHLPELYYTNRDEFERLLGHIESGVYDLLMNNSEHLAWLLYRIDVREKDSKKAFEESDTHKIASALTQLIVQRLLEKYESRKQHPPVGGDY
ncbi:hypothetical protein LBMAG25_13500 [Bacteroidota bacterium]|nr:hypothetical protein LBMAG25_13500 [Bacteroidota bacterium]